MEIPDKDIGLNTPLSFVLGGHAMDDQQIELRLKRARDDPPESDPRFQEELGEFSNSLRATSPQ